MLSKKFTSNPANYLYMFASEEFLAMLDKRSQEIIRAKAYYQKKLIVNAVTNDGYDAARAELRQAMIDIYGKTPAELLVALANGETVAGKNWAQGIYGVGDVKTNTFSSNQAITVDPETGAIMRDGTVVSSGSTALIGRNKKHNNVIGYTYTDESGTCYTSQYNSISGKYFCGRATSSDGVVRLADGTIGDQSNMSSLWEGILSGLQDFINNLLSYLTEMLKPGEKILTEKDALPDQRTDGFATDSNNGTDWLPLVLAGGAAAAIIIPKMNKSKKSKK